MTDDGDSFFWGFVPLLAVFLSRFFIPSDIDPNAAIWLLWALCGLVIVIGLWAVTRGHFLTLIGLAIGSMICINLALEFAVNKVGLSIEGSPYVILSFAALMIGFPFGLALGSGGIPRELLTGFFIGCLGSLYIALAFSFYSVTGLSRWLFSPFDPRFQFGELIGAEGKFLYILDAAGTCAASAIDVVLLGLPAFLVIGGIAVVRER